MIDYEALFIFNKMAFVILNERNKEWQIQFLRYTFKRKVHLIANFNNRFEELEGQDILFYGTL